MSGSISPSISPILSTSPELHTTPTSPHYFFPQLDTPSISTISSPETSTHIPTSIATSLAPIFPKPPIIISPISVEIPNPQTSQSEPLVIVHEGTISTTKEMADFGEDVVVSLGKCFWSRKDKVVVKKGAKRTREGTFKQVSTPSQIIWKRDSSDTKQGALDTTAAMGDFDRENFDSVSQLNKELKDKEQELQNAKNDLEQAKVHHMQEIQLLKKEYEEKLNHLQNKNDYMKQQLAKVDLLAK